MGENKKIINDNDTVKRKKIWKQVKRDTYFIRSDVVYYYNSSLATKKQNEREGTSRNIDDDLFFGSFLFQAVL